MRTILMTGGLAGLLTLGGCAQLSQVMDSPQGKQFCSWAPVAVVAIQSAALETAKDPAKANVSDALGQAAMYLRLAASQCPPVVPAGG